MKFAGAAAELTRGRQALSLKLGRHGSGGRHGGGCAGRERLQQRLALGGERRPVVQPVDRDQSAVGLVLEGEGTTSPAGR